MNFFLKSKKHCDDTNETYFQHMFVALKISFKLLKASLMALIHSIIPALFEKGASNKIITLYQQRKFTPEKGTVLIWPASYTHPHRGNPPISDKYIATGWYQVDTGSIYDHILKKNQKIKTN